MVLWITFHPWDSWSINIYINIWWGGVAPIFIKIPLPACKCSSITRAIVAEDAEETTSCYFIPILCNIFPAADLHHVLDCNSLCTVFSNVEWNFGFRGRKQKTELLFSGVESSWNVLVPSRSTLKRCHHSRLKSMLVTALEEELTEELFISLGKRKGRTSLVERCKKSSGVGKSS